MGKYYVTTPIYYVNDVPHIGHAYTSIAADVLARYHKSKGEDVFFLTGVDEHGAKIAEAAKKAGKTPKDFVDELAPKFEEMLGNLNIEYSQFFRTTNPEHENLVQEFVLKLKEKGFVEKRQYEGLYCISCERYYQKDELIVGIKCPDHKRDCVKQSEENYFFLLSKFQDKLIKVIESDEFEIGPEARKNEVLGKLKLGLEDVSISRAAVEWGIPFPGDEKQTIYVWIDALLNYYTATKIYFDKEAPTPSTSPSGRGRIVWPADLHLMAKDILWFHAIIWPALLLAVDLPLPKKVFAHGFFTIDGQKMSKSIGNVIDPNKMVEKFGADAVRYALLREFPFGEDGDISEEKIGKRYEEDLANGLGNLLQRTLVMIKRYNINPILPIKLVIDRNDFTIDKKIAPLSDTWGSLENKQNLNIREWIAKKIGELKFDIALAEIWNLVTIGNKFINSNKPWELAKNEKKQELQEILNTAYELIYSISQLIESFMPGTAEKIKKQLETLEAEVLFPRIEKPGTDSGSNG